MRKIKVKNLVITTRECGPKDAPIAAGRNGTVIRVQGDRYLVLFGSTPTDIREVWLGSDDIKLPPTLGDATNPFKHKVKLKTLDRFGIRPGTDEWSRLWDAAKAQPWWANSKEIGYIGCDETFWYFQKRGVTTGFARIVRA